MTRTNKTALRKEGSFISGPLSLWERVGVRAASACDESYFFPLGLRLL
jgi:hypothetical protein